MLQGRETNLNPQRGTAVSNLVPIDALQVMAGAMAKSNLFGFKTPEQAMALMLVAQAEGEHPATIAQDYDVIQGRPARKTHSVLARFQKAGGTVQWEELTDKRAVGVFTHPQGGSFRCEWTIEQAQKIGLTSKDNWRHYPRAMLRARTIAEGVRTVYPAAIGGALVVEEAQDMAPAIATVRHMGTAAVVETAEEPPRMPEERLSELLTSVDSADGEDAIRAAGRAALAVCREFKDKAAAKIVTEHVLARLPKKDEAA